MNELLKALYDNFYDELPTPQLTVEIERCHRELVETLDKPERWTSRNAGQAGTETGSANHRL